MANTEERLKNMLEKIADEKDYAKDNIDIKPISSGGANYTSALYLATISAAPKPDLNIFAKIGNVAEEFRAMNPMAANLYLIEVLFYTELFPKCEKLYEKYNVPAEDRLPIPKYYSHDVTPLKEALVLENLEARGFENFDRMKTYDWEYAALAVKQLANFHALGVALKIKYPEEYNKIDNFEVDFFTNSQMITMIITQSINNGINAVNDEYKERLQKYFSSPEVAVQLMLRYMQDKKMLVHGDYRPSNLMHRRQDGKLEIIPLDYQTLRLSNPVTDLMHFIFTGSDEEFRKEYYDQLLEHYYAELTVSLKRLQIDVENVYPKKVYDQDLIEARPLGLSMGMMLTAMVTVKPDDAPTIGGKTVEDFNIKPNQLAQERLNGIVRDFIRWGVL